MEAVPPLIVARQHGILRSWKKAGKWKAFSHLQRYDKAELEKAVLDIPILEAELHHLRMALFAFDAIILARDARIARLSRLLRMRKRPGWRRSACGL